jgi:hypothetical protein
MEHRWNDPDRRKGKYSDIKHLTPPVAYRRGGLGGFKSPLLEILKAF